MEAINENVGKQFSNEDKKVAIALWKAKVPLKTIRAQCKMSEKEWIQDIKRLWTIEMENSEFRKKLVDSMPRRLEEVIERQGASTKY